MCCMICQLLDKDKLTWQEADDILYKGEIEVDSEHFIEVLKKIEKKEKELSVSD